ncbi:methionyl-tRNA formyltransferase [Arenibacter sp. GZD96]|uniref:methionyl-tRNA formyltransferase n=1 Tax=Aurantibrevibacter litoralis TaxID=3106030 RepID=UPI002AFEF3E4|nr:methionyl-tRNA formyltransferase [Arenibacter sp. GZD-96]MEA1787132.1 methionyl-tRNA formyltransferase [Arenibacter sp. GZD-96]
MKLGNMEPMRILFMGTPDFAVASLAMLLAHNYDVVAVVTAADKPAGRGRKPQQSAVKQYALSHDIRVLQPTNLKSDTFLDELRSLDANLFIVVAFRMLPKSVWSLPKYGTFNLHASLLPSYRGAAPINWAIINGEKETGVTTFYIDDKIDTGEILLQETTPIHIADTAGTLHDTLMKLGAQVVLNTVLQIQQKLVTPKPQKGADAFKMAPKLDKETCRINWNLPAATVYNHIRGLSPYPTAWTLLDNDSDPVMLKIYNAQFEIAPHNYESGKVIGTKKNIKIAVKDGFILPTELQLPGKRRMSVQEMLNGIKWEKWGNVR